jgi:threonine/homoserine/homoserine lactone efflux protein
MLPTTSLMGIFFFAFMVAIGAVISPGPISTTIVSQSARQGWRVGPLVSTGHAVLELLVVALLVGGLGSVLDHPTIRAIIALVGGILLAFMGLSMLWDLQRGKASLPASRDSADPVSTRHLLGLGVLASAGNPFWYTWWVTVAASYLAQAKAVSAGAVAAFYLGHISADYAWNLTLSTIVSRGRRWFTNTIYHMLIAACAVFFLYLAAVFIRQGFALGF